MSNIAFLALGSNIGDREKYLIDAINFISLTGSITVTKVSDIYETEPVGYLEQKNFLNMVIKVETFMKPLELLKELQKIEVKLQRTREIHWGPRTIDIDILLYGSLKLMLPDLTIPHPRMFERAFVLIPLLDIYPEKEVDGIKLVELIEKCSDRLGVKLYGKLKTIK